MTRLKVLFFVEGNTDIRFVTGLSEICELTMAVPSAHYGPSGLDQRVQASGCSVKVHQIDGGRLLFQFASFFYLFRRAQQFDVILCQEVLRGAVNGTVAGALKRIPVITYMGISPVEYFRCRRERGQIGPIKAFVGETVIRLLMTVSGKLATKCLTMGPYLREVAAGYCRHTGIGLYYGVDTDLFRPASDLERMELRIKRDLPIDKFVVFFSSRISHEKDPETVLCATAMARKRGLDAVVINLGGGYKDFLKLAHQLRLENIDEWVLGRSAAHPMKEVADYFRSADVMALASLAEGAGISPLEALACGTPAVCTAVGGMKTLLQGYARLTPKQDAVAMCEEFLWVAANREQARAQARLGRDYVVKEWSRRKAFADLGAILREVVEENVQARSSFPESAKN